MSQRIDITLFLAFILLPPPSLIQGWELSDVADTLMKYTDNIPNELMRVGFVDFIQEFLDNESDGCAVVTSTFLNGFKEYTDETLRRNAIEEPASWRQLQKLSRESFEKLPKTIYCNEASELFITYGSVEIETALFKAGLAYLNRLIKDPCTSSLRAFLNSLADHKEAYEALQEAVLTYTAEAELIFNPEGCKRSVENFITKHGKELRGFLTRNEL